ncbi:hypothetical protein, partial [Sporolactobacillus inulinus]|uniref:hypothetical protein n=1 Tax=Sporolactobacillus inulinus TaxID=2078 RepID=UPI001C3FA8D3
FLAKTLDYWFENGAKSYNFLSCKKESGDINYFPPLPDIYKRQPAKPRTSPVKRYMLLSLWYPMSKKTMGDSAALNDGNSRRLRIVCMFEATHFR